MLSSKVKDGSLAVLKIVMALFIVVAPTLLGFLSIELSACLLFLLMGLMYVARVRKTGQGHMSVFQLGMLFLLAYSAISTLWVSNKSGHGIYMLIISSLIMFFGIVTEYFSENNDEKAQRRMMYMLSLSGTVCALWNFIYWVVALLPFGKKEPFMQGLGNSDFLALYMILCVIVTYKLIRGNKQSRKVLFVISILIMAFVFVMAGGIGWFFLAVFVVMYFSTRRTKKFFVPITLAFSAIFLIVVLIAGNAAQQGSVFKDVFGYGMKNLVGCGGGFWSARQMFFSEKYTDAMVPGLFASLCASSGIIGIACCVVIAGRVVLQFVKLKTWVSAANIFVTVMVLFMPFGQSLIPLFLWMGLVAYNEKDGNFSVEGKFNEKTVKYITYIVALAGVFTVVLLCQTLMKSSALDKYNNEKYIEAYELYNTAASINPTDGESCRMAAKSLYASDSITKRYSEAVSLVDKAVKRDRYNLENTEIKAQIYYKCEMYDLSAKEYMVIASKVKDSGRYNLETVRSLYNIICTKEKGSADAKTLYEKMVVISENTSDLDYKEKINNIIDKALVYTKGELAVE